jgi:putative transcriptional regulator
LVADPFLKDPNFKRTVVFICEHQQEGSFGFVINRDYHHTLADLITSAEGLYLPVYYGGPVQTDTVHFLHQYPDIIDGSVKVSEGVYWGGNFETAVDLIKRGDVEPDKIKFFIGYSGWGEGQLDEEMTEKTWLTVNATRNLVFGVETEEIWKAALKHMGGEFEMMVNFPIDPQLN